MQASRLTIRCPHCRERAITMTSRELSATVREIYLQCVNAECGHRFVAHLGIVRTLVPSLNPSADVSLPIVERRSNDIIVPKAPPTPTPTAPDASPAPASHNPAPPALN